MARGKLPGVNEVNPQTLVEINPQKPTEVNACVTLNVINDDLSFKSQIDFNRHMC